ncbi:hypothetical protein PG995_014659 [Apiospora arundinis]
MDISYLRVVVYKANNVDFIWAICTFKERQATDPRDKIFGVLGLFPNIAPHVTVDYSAHYSKICTDLFLHLITSTLDLEAWTCLVGAQIDPLLPTWVPNFYLNYPPEFPLGNPILQRYGKGSAARGTTLQFGRPQKDVLSVVGICVGRIAHTLSCGTLSREESKSAIDNFFRRASIAVQQGYPSGRSYEEAALELHSGVTGCQAQMDVFITDRGYAGYAYHDLTVADTVHVIFGGKLPFIFRQSEREDEERNRYHRLVGPCVIHGLDDGSALDWGAETEAYFLV